PRLPGRGHRRAGGLAALRARRRHRPRRVHRADGALRRRVPVPDRGRPRLRLLPPLVPRLARGRGDDAHRGHARRARRPDRPRDRPAPAPAVLADVVVPAGRALVPVVRGRRLQLERLRDGDRDRLGARRAAGADARPERPGRHLHDRLRGFPSQRVGRRSPERGLTALPRCRWKRGMAARLSALLPRLAALTVIWLLATSTITFAAAGRNQAAATKAPKKTAKIEAILVVPDVRRQAYVFAKGILEDGGFAWRVDGGVQGYAANIV